MNNYCRNCGNKLDSNTKVCSKCGLEVLEIDSTDDVKNIVNTPEYKKKENIYVIIVIALFLLSVFAPSIDNLLGKNSFFSSISPLFTVATMIILIFARITMRESKKIEILFNVFMTLMLLGIFLIVVFTITCMNTMNNCY